MNRFRIRHERSLDPNGITDHRYPEDISPRSRYIAAMAVFEPQTRKNRLPMHASKHSGRSMVLLHTAHWITSDRVRRRMGPNEQEGIMLPSGRYLPTKDMAREALRGHTTEMGKAAIPLTRAEVLPLQRGLGPSAALLESPKASNTCRKANKSDISTPGLSSQGSSPESQKKKMSIERDETTSRI